MVPITMRIIPAPTCLIPSTYPPNAQHPWPCSLTPPCWAQLLVHASDICAPPCSGVVLVDLRSSISGRSSGWLPLTQGGGHSGAAAPLLQGSVLVAEEELPVLGPVSHAVVRVQPAEVC